MSQRLSMLEKLIEKGSQDPFVHYARAMELRSLGREDDALGAFELIRARFPAYVPTYLMAGQLAVERGRLELARDFFERGLDTARKQGDSHAESELGTALAALPPESEH